MKGALALASLELESMVSTDETDDARDTGAAEAEAAEADAWELVDG